MRALTAESPVTFRDPVPDATDVVIVGGGIAGVMTAWFLQKAGKRVLICEKGRIAAEQSGVSWGFVRQAGRHPAELPIMMDSMSVWQELQDEVGDEIGFRRPGSLFVSKFKAQAASYEQWAETVGKPHGLPTRMVTPKEIDRLLGMPHTEFAGALYTERDGCAEPFTAMPAAARCLHARGGVSIREECAVRLLEIAGGRVTGVHTEDGLVKADQVLISAGLWSGRFLHNHGLRFPQLLVNTTLVRTEPVQDRCHLAFGYSDACFRARLDGGYNLMPGEVMQHELCFDTFAYGLQFLPALKEYYRHLSVTPGFYRGFKRRMFPRRRWTKDDVTPFEETRVLTPRRSKRHERMIQRRIAKHLPKLAELDVVETWTGSADMTPDILPALGDIERYPGLYIASGFSGHGFGLGPGAGKVMANHLLDKPPQFDLSPFRFERFSKPFRD